MGDDLVERDLRGLVVPDVGRLESTGERWVPYQLLDANGAVIEPVAVYFAELQGCDRSVGTIRSYGHDLLRWWRFLGAVGVVWDRATRVEARDFMRWMMLADKPERVHWRRRDGGTARPSAGAGRARTAGEVNAVTGKLSPAKGFSPASRAHAETVLRAFYDFQLEVGSDRESFSFGSVAAGCVDECAP
jgi:integrase family protein with SAM-like domain